MAVTKKTTAPAKKTTSAKAAVKPSEHPSFVDMIKVSKIASVENQSLSLPPRAFRFGISLLELRRDIDNLLPDYALDVHRSW